MNSKYIKPNGKLVTTISGEQLPKKHCRLINKKYYKMGKRNIKDSGDVYQILSNKSGTKKWYRSNTGYIVYDYRKSMYMLKTDLEVIVENGIVGIDKNQKPIFGTFSQDLKNPSITQVSFDGKIYICLSEEIIKNCQNFQEAISDGIYYERQSIPALQFTEPISCSKEYKNSLPYDSKGITKKWIKMHEEKYKPVFLQQVEDYHHVLGDLTFGLEFETIKGKIPDSICNNLGLIPLRDGSIEGLEYVTIPLQGKNGLQTVIDSVNQLKRRTRYDNNCSLHIHYGNIPRTEEFFIGLYKVLFKIQEEMYDMFPLHKFKNFGIKKKHYTKPLPLGTMLKLDNKISSKTVKENFNHVYSFLSMGSSYANFGNHLDNIISHPSDPQGTSKWNIRTRYHWVNLIPLLFGNKQTVEFRIHTPTYDANKIVNYLILCASIVNFTKNNLSNILKNSNSIANLTLHDLLLMTIPKKDNVIIAELSNYIDQRKEYINRRTRDGDLIAIEKDFRYNHKYVNWKAPLTNDDLERIANYGGRRLKKKSSLGFDPVITTTYFNNNPFLGGVGMTPAPEPFTGNIDTGQLEQIEEEDLNGDL